jgi:hypothetical protein
VVEIGAAYSTYWIGQPILAEIDDEGDIDTAAAAAAPGAGAAAKMMEYNKNRQKARRSRDSGLLN